VSSSSLAAGQGLTLSGANWPANASLQATIFSAPILLGTFTASPTGTFSAVLTVPTVIDPGAHRVVVAQTPSGVTAEVPLTVTPSTVVLPPFIPPALAAPILQIPAASSAGAAGASRTGGVAFTGHNSLPLAAVGVTLFVIGAGGRRRSRRPTP
jgi:hypothetical protein